jgi:hypothetical protein
MAFKYHAAYSWTHPKGFYSNIIEFFYWIKFFIQRGWRGYSDYDIGDVDGYLLDIMPPMLKQLKKVGHGHPANLTEHQWNMILDRMVKGLEAGNRILEDNYLDDIQPHWYEELPGDSLMDTLHRHPITKESWKKWRKAYNADERRFHAGMKLLDHWFFGLWD